MTAKAGALPQQGSSQRLDKIADMYSTAVSRIVLAMPPIKPPDFY